MREEEKVPVYEKFAYGAGDIYGGGQSTLISLILLYFFTDIVGINPAFAGIVILISKIFDGVIDPWLGKWSDNTRLRFGRRKPFILAGGLLIIPALFLLFAPIQNLSQGAKTAWLVISYITYCGISSLSQVSYNSLSNDISPDYRERNSANLYKLVFNFISASICFILPSILMGKCKSGAMTPMQFTYSIALGFGLFFTIPIVIAAFVVKERNHVRNSDDIRIRDYGKILSIRSFRYHLIMYVCSFICFDMISAIAMYYTATVLRGVRILGMEAQTVFIVAPIMGCAFLGLFFIYRIMNRKGKQYAYRIGIPLFILSIGFLAIFQPTWNGNLIIVAACLAGFGFCGCQMMPWLIFPDTVDVAYLKLHKQATASMSAIMTFSRTICTAVATSMIGVILNFAGYQQSTAGTVIEQAPSVAVAVRMILGLSALILMGIAFAVSIRYKVKGSDIDMIKELSKKDDLTDSDRKKWEELESKLC